MLKTKKLLSYLLLSIFIIGCNSEIARDSSKARLIAENSFNLIYNHSKPKVHVPTFANYLGQDFSKNLFSSTKESTLDSENQKPYRDFVRIVIKNTDEKLLVLRSKYGEKYFWIFPGGEVESGESRDDAVKRELMEKLNLNAPPYKYLGSLFSKPYKGVNWKGHFYLSDPVSHENFKSLKINQPDRCSEVAFLSLDDLYTRVVEEDSYVTRQILEEFFVNKR